MKIRSNYVSNSSSSSFIVNKDLSNKGVSCLKLSDEQKKLINGTTIYGQDVIKLNLKKDYWLTQFISDCDKKYDEVYKLKHIFYMEGQLCEQPRDYDFFNEYQVNEFGASVYLLKQHDVSKQMTLNQFVKEYKKTDLPKEFLVKYEPDGIKLVYIW